MAELVLDEPRLGLLEFNSVGMDVADISEGQICGYLRIRTMISQQYTDQIHKNNLAKKGLKEV